MTPHQFIPILVLVLVGAAFAIEKLRVRQKQGGKQK